MKIKLIATCMLAALSVSSVSAPALASEHCIADAKARGARLLTFHFNDRKEGEVLLQIDDKVERLAPAAALKGDGQFDVLEVFGYIYKATYRMHFLYAQIQDSCVLMGQEIIEVSDPY
jgi:hypothetical protein